MRRFFRTTLLSAALLLTAAPVFAFSAVFEPTRSSQFFEHVDFSAAAPIADPHQGDEALYGRLSLPHEVELYSFTAASDGTYPIEAFVPQRESNANFLPTIAVIGTALSTSPSTLPFTVPDGMGSWRVDTSGTDRSAFSEHFTSEHLWHGTPKELAVSAGKTYYLAVYSPDDQSGDYVIGLGDIAGATSGPGSSATLAIKLGAGRPLLPLDLLGAFFLIIGFALGLGSASVFELLSWIARSSKYWNEAMIRTHKITKPLTWVGLVLATIGGLLLYRQTGLSGTALYHLYILLILVANGCFVTFSVSPMSMAREKSGYSEELLSSRWRRALAISSVISFISWWSAALLFAWQMVILR